MRLLIFSIEQKIILLVTYYDLLEILRNLNNDVLCIQRVILRTYIMIMLIGVKASDTSEEHWSNLILIVWNLVDVLLENVMNEHFFGLFVNSI